MKQQKGQIQLGESIFVVFIIIFLIVFGLVFYLETAELSLKTPVVELITKTDNIPETIHADLSEEEQAEYLVEAYEYAAENWQPWIGLMTTIYFADQSWTEENEQWWWSIVLPDGTPRQSYDALSAMDKQ